VIEKILCESRLNFEEIEKKYEIDFSFYFKEELLALDKFVKMKVAFKNENGLVLTDLGAGFTVHKLTRFQSYSTDNLTCRRSTAG